MKNVHAFILTLTCLFFFLSCGFRPNKEMAEQVIENQRSAVYEKLTEGKSHRMEYPLMDSVWFAGTEFVIVLPDSLSGNQKIELEKATRTDSIYHSGNTIIAYRRGQTTDYGSFHAFPENKEEGLHFLLPPAEKQTIHILKVKQATEQNGMAYYIGLERKF